MIEVPFRFSNNQLVEIKDLKKQKIQEIKIYFYTLQNSRMMRPELGNPLYKKWGEFITSDALSDFNSDILDHLNNTIRDVEFKNISIEMDEDNFLNVNLTFKVGNNVISYDTDKILIRLRNG